MTERNGSSRDRGDWGADPELRTLLRTMDQAHSLPPLSSPQVAALVATTLEADAELAPVVSRQGRRTPFPPLAAAAALVVAGLLAWSTLSGGEGDVPLAGAPSASATAQPDVAAPTPTTPTAPTAPTPSAPGGPQPAPAPTRLELESVPGLKCAVPNVEMLQLQQVAFAGTVSAIDGSLVTLTPSQVFRGDVTDTVQVQAPSADLAQLLSAVSFEEGGSYLVSATDGQVTLCGFSAADTPELRALYEQAFAG